MFFWPFSNAHELNLDWIIQQIKQQDTNLQNFVALNTIKYADPFQWTITGQYAQNTLVIDPSDGTAYLSIKPVPLGVQITNTEYWTPVFTLQNFIDPLKAAICRSVPQQEDGQAATQKIPAHSLFFVGDTLCTCSDDIPVTSLVIIGSNCQQISMEEVIKGVLAMPTAWYRNSDTSINMSFPSALTDIAVYGDVHTYIASENKIKITGR